MLGARRRGRRKRVSYRALKLQFKLDDAYLDVLKEELIDIQQLAVDQGGRMLVWTGDTKTTPVSISQPAQTSEQPTAQEETSTQVVSPPPEPHAPDAERRQLTILFTDLVDSTKLSGQLDAEDYRDVVRAYQAACAEVIERFDCHLAQTLGDGLLVYSGYPLAHENDAERAVRTGLGILDCVFHGKAATDSTRSLPRIPRQSCHRFHAKPAIDSTAKLPRIPRQSCHP